MEKMCQSLKNDVGIVGQLSQEIEKMQVVIQERDSEIQSWRNKVLEYSAQAQT